jgi:hypothetical protein
MSAVTLTARVGQAATENTMNTEQPQTARFLNPPPAGLASCQDLSLALNGVPVWVEHLEKTCPDNAPAWFRAGSEGQLTVNIAAFPCSGPSRLAIHLQQPATGLIVRPKHLHIAVTGQDQDWALELPGPCHLYVEIGSLPPLLIFADSKEEGTPPDPTKALVFGPGVHDAGLITLKDGEQVYLAPGAIVYGGLRGSPHGARVFGRGILDGSKLDASAISLDGASKVVVEGIVVRCGKGWQDILRNCDNVTYRDVKVLSFGPNGDGLDLVCSRHIRVENCFFRCSDDCIAVKGLANGPSIADILVQGCVMAGYTSSDGFTVGFEAAMNSIQDITVRNCDILYARGGNAVGGHSAFSIICDGPAVDSNITFEDIRVEENVSKLFELNVTSGALYTREPPGHIRHIRLKSIQWDVARPLLLRGYDKEHRVEDVVFDNCKVAGRPLSAAQIQSNEFVTGVVVR